MQPRPILVLNPRSDRSFVTHVDHLSREELTTAAALQARLRQQFPGAVVHARGLSGEDVTMWYVYRDGHWTRDQPQDPRMIELSEGAERIAREIVPETVARQRLVDDANTGRASASADKSSDRRRSAEG